MTKKRLFEIVEASATRGDTASNVFDYVIGSLILINAAAIILDSMAGVRADYDHALTAIEYVSVSVFTVEYLLRMYSCTSRPEYSRPVVGRIKYGFQFYTLVDLVAVAPFWIPMFFGFDLAFLRLLRLMRIVRVMKFGRYSKSIQDFSEVFREKLPDIANVLFMLFIAVLVASTGIYYLEHQAQPEDFSSIPATMWWAVVTLTTVGYGDMSPITPLGKLMASFIAILGIGIFALPAGILSSGFTHRAQADKCPKCGHRL